jgi:VWFA-related protein
MRQRARRRFVAALGSLLALGSAAIGAQDGFRFKSGVDLVNVTATVSGADGRFLGGLTKEDFTVYDDGVAQEITHFSSERVPVSLGILLDTSGSMTDDKMSAARAAINRFITTLLDPEDELFLVEFADAPRVREDWTTDRARITRSLNRVVAGGGTALHDAIAEALPIAAAGKHRKKAILVISDGNDRNSRVPLSELRQAIRESEVLVYALGVDGREPPRVPQTQTPPPRPPVRTPFPIPGTGGGGIPGIPGTRPRTPARPLPQIVFGQPYPSSSGERVNPDALRQITDDTGGRTEIIRALTDLDAATARIADELSRQYSLGYISPARDGRWHQIRVEVRDRRATVRARRGYMAS